MREKIIEVEKLEDGGYQLHPEGNVDDIFNAVHGQIRYLAYTQGKEFEDVIFCLENSEAELLEEEGKPSKQIVAEVLKSEEDNRYYSTLVADYDEQIRIVHMLAKNIATNSGRTLADVLAEIDDIDDDYVDGEEEALAQRRS